MPSKFKALERAVTLSFAIGAIALSPACKSKGPAGGARGPAEVGVETLRPERVVLTTELPGRTSAYLVAEVRPQVSGILRDRLFEEGASVQAGALLYQIDPAQYRAAHEQAKAALSVAEAGLPALKSRAERLGELVKIHAVGEQDYDNAVAALRQAEAGVEAAKAAAESARINLSYTPIKSPISGRIGKSSVTVGALVAAYQPIPLAVVQQLDPIYVDVTQSTAELLRLKRSMASGRLKGTAEVQKKVKLILEDGTPYPLPGVLKFRDVTADPTTGSVTLRMVFPNPDFTLLPGMFVRAVIEEGTDDDALLVPQQGVTRNPRGDALVWLVDSSEKVEQRQVVLERAIGDRWLVTKGLDPGARVIVEGAQRVHPGDPVHAAPFVPSTGAEAPSSKAQPPVEKK
jgi:membrane fusion protein (multidrug efflux system)